MIFRHEYRGGIWLDLEKPTEEEVRHITREFNISSRFEQELLSPTPLPHVTGDGDMALVVLHFPTEGTGEGETRNQEIDFIVAKNFILTLRYEIVTPLHHLKKLLEAQQLIEGSSQVTTEVLLEILFAHLFTAMHDHTNHIAENLARVEQEMFDGRERLTIRSISNISRQFLHIEATLANQEESLHHFLEALIGYGFFGPSFPTRTQRMLTERTHVARIVKTHREMASELRETNIALIESRQNEIMKTLTVITFIFLPLELITFVFGMHAPGTPLENNPNAFWIIGGAMISIGIGITMFLARKRWIF